MTHRSIRLTALLAAALLAGGCTYYQITDPHSGKVYYTTNWDSKGKESGVIVFKDAASGSKVTLANHEVRKVSQRKWEASVDNQIADAP